MTSFSLFFLQISTYINRYPTFASPYKNIACCKLFNQLFYFVKLIGSKCIYHPFGKELFCHVWGTNFSCKILFVCWVLSSMYGHFETTQKFVSTWDPFKYYIIKVLPCSDSAMQSNPINKMNQIYATTVSFGLIYPPLLVA